MTLIADERFVCPVCGGRLLSMPYETYPGPQGAEQVDPPYEDVWGKPSYEVCSGCGFEFGNDDNPGTATPTSFADYRAAWAAAGKPPHGV